MSILKVADIVDRQQAFAAGFGINARKVHGLSEEEYETICKIASVIMEKTMVKAAQMAQRAAKPITPVPTNAPAQSPEAQPPTTVVPLAPGQEADVKRKEFVKSRAVKDQEAANKAAIMWPKKTAQDADDLESLRQAWAAESQGQSWADDERKRYFSALLGKLLGEGKLPKSIKRETVFGIPYAVGNDEIDRVWNTVNAKTAQVVPPSPPAFNPPEVPGLKPGESAFAASKPQDATKKVAPIPKTTSNPATGYPYGYRPAARRNDPTSPGSLSPGFYKWMKEKGLL